jgi:hypothetical protein
MSSSSGTAGKTTLYNFVFVSDKDKYIDAGGGDGTCPSQKRGRDPSPDGSSNTDREELLTHLGHKFVG